MQHVAILATQVNFMFEGGWLVLRQMQKMQRFFYTIDAIEIQQSNIKNTAELLLFLLIKYFTSKPILCTKINAYITESQPLQELKLHEFLYEFLMENQRCVYMYV